MYVLCVVAGLQLRIFELSNNVAYQRLFHPQSSGILCQSESLESSDGRVPTAYQCVSDV